MVEIYEEDSMRVGEGRSTLFLLFGVLSREIDTKRWERASFKVSRKLPRGYCGYNSGVLDQGGVL